MDEEFGPENFIAVVVWQKVYSPKNSAKHLSVDQDYLLIYARLTLIFGVRTRFIVPRRCGLPIRIQTMILGARGSQVILWQNKPCSPGGIRLRLLPAESSRGHHPVGIGGSQPRLSRTWTETIASIGAQAVRTCLRSLVPLRGSGSGAPDVVDVSRGGPQPTAKNEIQALFPGETPFDTPKPERLLERSVVISTVPGDVVLTAAAPGRPLLSPTR